MPIVVHLTDARLRARILRSGIAPSKYFRAVYFMPVLRNFFFSHQWLRELKRRGVREFIGVYARLSARELVWAGHYNAPHEQMTLGAAFKLLQDAEHPLGWEYLIQRKIEPREIVRTRELPQNIGWRYMPAAHDREPCGCPVCNPRGSFKARQLREKFDPRRPRPKLTEIKLALADATTSREIIAALWDLWCVGRWRADPQFLERFAVLDDPNVREELADVLKIFRHRRAKMLLAQLAEDVVPAVRQAARDSLTKPD